MDGNQALAYGLIAAGVRYGAGYPITPWSSIMETLATRVAEIRRNFCAGGGRARRGLARARFFVFRISRGHRQRRPGHFAQSRSDRLGVDGGDPAHHLQYSTRRTEHRIADQRRAKRFASGDLRQSRRQSARRARGSDAWKIVSTSRLKRPGSRANTARRFSF